MAFFDKKPETQPQTSQTPQTPPMQPSVVPQPVVKRKWSFDVPSDLSNAEIAALLSELSKEQETRVNASKLRAIEEARKLLEAAGMSLADLSPKKKVTKKVPLYRTVKDGVTHEWKGRGPKPEVFKAMTKEQLKAAKVE